MVKVAILWHRFYFNNGVYMGLAAPINEDPACEKTNGLPITDERFWIVRKPNEEYTAYKVSTEELEDLDREHRFRMATVGGTINHDSTHTCNIVGEVPEELKEDMYADESQFPKGTVKEYNAPLELKEVLFEFPRSDIVNMQPAAVSLGFLTF